MKAEEAYAVRSMTCRGSVAEIFPSQSFPDVRQIFRYHKPLVGMKRFEVGRGGPPRD